MKRIRTQRFKQREGQESKNQIGQPQTLKIVKAIKFVVNKKIGKWKRQGSGKTQENEKTNKGYLSGQIKTR